MLLFHAFPSSPSHPIGTLRKKECPWNALKHTCFLSPALRADGAMLDSIAVK